MGSFADSILANIAEVKKEVNDQIVDVFVELSNSVVELTPSPSWGNSTRGNSGNVQVYSDGLLANQWYVGENKQYEGYSRDTSDNGKDSLLRISQAKDSKVFLGKDGYLSLTNNVPYAYRVDVLGYRAGDAESLEGFEKWFTWNGSHQKPYAMVDQSLVKIKAKL